MFHHDSHLGLGTSMPFGLQGLPEPRSPEDLEKEIEKARQERKDFEAKAPLERLKILLGRSAIGVLEGINGRRWRFASTSFECGNLRAMHIVIEYDVFKKRFKVTFQRFCGDWKEQRGDARDVWTWDEEWRVTRSFTFKTLKSLEGPTAQANIDRMVRHIKRVSQVYHMCEVFW